MAKQLIIDVYSAPEALLTGDVQSQASAFENTTWRWHELPSVETALDEKQEEKKGLPDVVLFIPAFAGEITRAFVDQIRNRNPLAALLCISGPWSEGEPRTAPLPAGVQRVQWHGWQAGLMQQLLQRDSINRPHFRPSTEQGIDAWLASDTQVVIDQQKKIPLVAIATSSQSDFEAWAEALGADSHSVWLANGRPLSVQHADILVWCFARSVKDEILAAVDVFKRLNADRFIGLVHFPRPEEVKRIQSQFAQGHCLAFPASRDDFRRYVLGFSEANKKMHPFSVGKQQKA